MPTDWRAHVQRVTQVHRHPWWPPIRRVLGALLIGFTLMAIILVLRQREEYIVLYSEVSTLRIENAELRERVKSLTVGFEAWTSDLDRFLTGQVTPAVERVEKKGPPPPPNRVELWSINKDKEMRGRTVAIEKWRLEVDAWRREVDAWRRRIDQEIK